MSVEIMFRLVCDGDLCRRQFGTPEGRTDGVMRREFEDLRAEAKKVGWRRFRPEIQWPLGDYCPKCTAELGLGAYRQPRPSGAKRVL